MNCDLISAYSCRISWKPEINAKQIDCFRSGFNQSAKFENNEISLVVVNLDPSLEYTVKLTLENGEYLHKSFKTSSIEEPCLDNMYVSLRNVDGQYDTTRLNKKVHDIFVEKFSNIVKSGDSILANVSIEGVSKEMKTVAVRDGEKINVTEESVFLPFSTENPSFMQTATIVHGDDEAVLSYDREEDAFGYGGEMFRVGDKFEIFGKTVTVGYGSIVLIFSDTVVKEWVTGLNYTDAKAGLIAAGQAGSSFTSTMNAATMNLVAEKTDTTSGSTYNSAWVYNTDTPATSEITRMVHTVDAANENATLSIGVLHTDVSLNRFIEPTIQSAYDYTSISAQDAADATRSAVFRSTGLQFDNDDSAVYFGAAQEFRIRFTSGSPDVLAVQYYDATAGDYVSKTEFSAGSS